MAEELNVGENVRLVVNGYHMFAQVRRCVPSESGFTIGLERIDGVEWAASESALVPLDAATTSPAKVLGRTEAKKPAR